jgi:hypothetical protein
MSTTRSTRRWVFTISSLAVAALFALAPSANAAKGGGSGGGGGKGGGGSTGGSGTMSLVMVNDQNADGLPNWDDSIRFNVSTTATTEPHVSVQCSQGGTLVYSAQTGYYDSYPWPSTQIFTLASGSWTGGAADCAARMYSLSNSGSSTTLSTMSFHANA